MVQAILSLCYLCTRIKDYLVYDLQEVRLNKSHYFFLKCHRSFSLLIWNVSHTLQLPLSLQSTVVFLSILCIFFILMHSGARGDTRKAIERAVCVPHDFHCVHLQMKKLREKLAGSLQMASQIYYNPGKAITVWSSKMSSSEVKEVDAEILCPKKISISAAHRGFCVLFLRNQSEPVLYWPVHPVLWCKTHHATGYQREQHRDDQQLGGK